MAACLHIIGPAKATQVECLLKVSRQEKQRERGRSLMTATAVFINSRFYVFTFFSIFKELSW